LPTLAWWPMPTLPLPRRRSRKHFLEKCYEPWQKPRKLPVLKNRKKTKLFLMKKSIGFAQFAVTFGDREANFAAIERLLTPVESADLIVLPGLCFTGYEFKDRAEVASLAEPF